MKIDDDYTQNDHSKRDEDAYARLKYQLTLRWLLGQERGPKRTLLNVGCGAGDFNALAQQTGFQVVGIEPDQKALEVAKMRSGSEIRLENVDIFNFHSESQYDVIVMHDVLEHIQDHQSAISAISKLIRKSADSKFIISVPAHQWLFGFHDEQLGHFRRYNPKTLKSVLEDFFEIKKVRRLGILGIPAAFWYSKLKRVPYPVGGNGLGNRIFDFSCKIERVLNLHIGSSIMILAIPKI